MGNSREKHFEFAALSFWIITSLAMAAYVLIEFGQDFRGYYAAARVLLAGGNPYDFRLVARVLMEVTGRAGNNPFYYPLWFGWFITPLSLLPFQIARLVWMILNWILWLVGLIRLQKLAGFPPKGWRTWLLNLLATFIFAWTTWKFEQTGILLFVIMVEALISYQKRRWNRTGIFLALALIKPNIMLLAVAALIAWLIRNRNWRPVITAAGVLAALIIFTSILTPNWYQSFFQADFGQGLTQVLDGPDKVTGTRLNTTLLDWLKWFSVPRIARAGIFALAALSAILILAIVIWRSDSIMLVAVTSLLVTFAITPYALQYDFPPLVIVLFWALEKLGSARTKLVPIMLVTFISSVLIWERPISDGYWIVIGLCALAYFAWKSSTNVNVAQSFTQYHPGIR